MSGLSNTQQDPIEYYDEKYYTWQERKGRFGGTADLIKFESQINKSDNVIDFGCGGGFILANLDCQEKIGVEINPAARANCQRLGIRSVESLDAIPDGWADKIISNHALEHVTDPVSTLRNLKPKLRPGGRMIFAVPCERVDTAYTRENVNQHLFTWSPVNLGNLFEVAGYEVIECKAFFHRWIPKGHIFQPIIGWKLFHAGSWVYGFLFRRLSQVRIIAKVR